MQDLEVSVETFLTSKCDVLIYDVKRDYRLNEKYIHICMTTKNLPSQTLALFKIAHLSQLFREKQVSLLAVKSIPCSSFQLYVVYCIYSVSAAYSAVPVLDP